MVTIARLDTVPDITGLTPAGESASLFDYLKPGRYALIWWYPQALSPASCKTCGGAAEPITLLQDIYNGGCDVIGLSYASPQSQAQYLYDIGLEYPMLSVTEAEARLFGTAKAEGEEWRSIPRRRAFLVDEHGQVINQYEVGEPISFLRTVADDVRNGPPTSKWEQPKRKKFLGLF